LLLFLKERKSDSSFFALFKRATKRAIAQLLFLKERANERLLFLSLFLFVALLKRAKKERSLIRSFAKSAEKGNRSFALLQRATKRVIAHLLFLKEQMSEQSLNRSFEKSGNER